MLILYPVLWAYQRHRQCNICHTALQKCKFKAARNISHERAIYCTSGQYIARAGDILHKRAIYWPNSLKLGQICPQYSSATILTVENVTYIDEKCVERTVQVFECVYAERCIIQRHFLQLCNWHYRRAFKGFCPTHKAQLCVVTL